MITQQQIEDFFVYPCICYINSVDCGVITKDDIDLSIEYQKKIKTSSRSGKAPVRVASEGISLGEVTIKIQSYNKHILKTIVPQVESTNTNASLGVQGTLTFDNYIGELPTMPIVFVSIDTMNSSDNPMCCVIHKASLVGYSQKISSQELLTVSLIYQPLIDDLNRILSIGKATNSGVLV